MANMFNEDGTYNKTEWKAGDKITAAKLNKIELSLEAINNNDIDRHVEADSRLDALEEKLDEVDNERINALEDMVKDNKDAADLEMYRIYNEIDLLEDKLDNELETIGNKLDNELETIENKLDNEVMALERELDDIDGNLEMIEGDRNNKYGVHKITRKTKKIFDDGCVLNVNNTGKAAEVCGFRSHNALSTYPDRDAVMVYIDGELPECEILEVVEFGTNHVRFNGTITEIEVGMIIDCMNQSEIDKYYQHEKYSGFVTDFNENTIYVSGWYKYQNASEGQIPDKNRIIINPVTRLWGKNVNVFLSENSFGWGGVGCEYGLFNSKSVSKGEDYYQLCGVDVVNFKGVCGVGYHIRKADGSPVTKTLIGYKSDNSEEAFVSNTSNVAGFTSNNDEKGFISNNSSCGFTSNSDSVGFKSNNNDVGFIADLSNGKPAFKTSNGKFEVYSDGSQGAYYTRRKVYTNDSTIDPDAGYIHFIGGGTNSLPNPSAYGGCIIKIMSTSDNCTLQSSNGLVTASGSVSSYALKAWNTIEVYCDADLWYILEKK